MPDINDNDIDALLRYLKSGHTPHWYDDSTRWHAALTALVAERDKLVEDNASQTYKGNSVRYWHDKASAYKATIGSLWEILESAAVRPNGERTITAALAALVAERNSLKQRVAELEARSKPVYFAHGQRLESIDLRERLVESALQGAARDAHMHHEASSMGTRAVYIVDAAIAAMRKGGARGK